MKMRMPSSFKIFEQTISVVWDKELANEDDAHGQAAYRHNEIRLQPSLEGRPIPGTQIEQTFWHEVVHWIFYLLGDYKINGAKLREDEQLVDLLAHALHQVLATAKYDMEG